MRTLPPGRGGGMFSVSAVTRDDGTADRLTDNRRCNGGNPGGRDRIVCGGGGGGAGAAIIVDSAPLSPAACFISIQTHGTEREPHDTARLKHGACNHRRNGCSELLGGRCAGRCSSRSSRNTSSHRRYSSCGSGRCNQRLQPYCGHGHGGGRQCRVLHALTVTDVTVAASATQRLHGGHVELHCCRSVHCPTTPYAPVRPVDRHAPQRPTADATAIALAAVTEAARVAMVTHHDCQRSRCGCVCGHAASPVPQQLPSLPCSQLLVVRMSVCTWLRR